MRTGTRCVGALALTLLMLTACSSGSESASEPDIGPVPTVRSGAEIVLPLEGYGLNPQEYGTVRRAAWRLIRDCVARFGGTYSVPESLMVTDAPRLEHPNDRRYGLLDAASAAARGYNLAPEQLPPPRERSGGWDPSDAEKLLVRGAPPGTAAPSDGAGQPLPEGGCQAEADRALDAGAPARADEDLANRLSVDAAHRAEADSRVRAVMEKWSACMKGRGFSFATVWDPNDRQWPEPAGAEEIATAQADIACKHETNVAGTWFAVERAYHERTIDERAEELKAVQTYVKALATNAARVASGR